MRPWRLLAQDIATSSPPPPPPMTTISLLDEFQFDGTVKVLVATVVINPRHTPPPMSVKVTLLPVPQVVALAA